MNISIDEVVERLSNFIERYFKDNLNDLKYSFLTKKYCDNQEHSIIESNLDIVWDSRYEYTQLDKPYRNFDYFYSRFFTLNGEITFIDLNGKLLTREYLNEKIQVQVHFNYDSKKYQFELFDEEKMFINNFEENINNLCIKNDMNYLDSRSFVIDGEEKKLSDYFFEVVRKNRTTPFSDKFHDYYFWNDCVRIFRYTQKLIAQLILYRPYTTNYLSNEMKFDGKTIYRYFPNLFDERYFMTSELVFNLIYNLGDRIGDLLNYCFKVIPEGKNIYFKTVVKNIPELYHNSENYIWLKTFSANEYDLLRISRDNFVHLETLENEYFKDYQNSYCNEEEMRNLQEKKYKIVDHLLNQNELMITALERTLRLIDGIP